MVDLHSDPGFQALGVELLALSPDTPEDWRAAAEEQGVTSIVLSDEGNAVARKYDVLQWAMPGGEPGHTFVLVDRDGQVQWIRDYGAPENGGLMYVPSSELLDQLRPLLEAS